MPRHMTDYRRMKSSRHTPSEYVPEDASASSPFAGIVTLIQAARDLAGQDNPMLGINRGFGGTQTRWTAQRILMLRWMPL